jgi:NAD(P)-dependent dehydrogenase (short-subunit alcohol dehydrogenase family)
VISLAGKFAVVTGAAGGIGAATARLLSTAGAAVVISDINIDGAKAVAEEIRSQGGTAQAVRTDISSEAEVKELIDKVGQAFGRLDVLDNNAGILGSNHCTGTESTSKNKPESRVPNTAAPRGMFCTHEGGRDGRTGSGYLDRSPGGGRVPADPGAATRLP